MRNISFTKSGIIRHLNTAGFPGGTSGKEPAISTRDMRGVGLVPGQEDPREEEMTTHSNILAWRIPWKEEPDRLQSMRSQRVGHD